MEIYLSNCLKAAVAAASKVVAHNVKTEKDTHGTSKPKLPILEDGAVSLLDKPLGTKLPIIPGSSNVYNTTDLHEKLHSPYRFNVTKPYCQPIDTTYKSPNDPHLKKYHGQKDTRKTLKKGGYISGNNKVICSTKDVNKYPKHLTSLKTDLECKYTKEQELSEKRINRMQEHHTSDRAIATKFQQGLSKEGKKTSIRLDQLLRRRYLQMIRKELDKTENSTGGQSAVQMKEEEQYWDNIRRQLDLQTQIDKDWKSKEMAQLKKIIEDVRREVKAKEYHRKIREEMDRKKQEMLQKRIAYHLQKMQIIHDEEKTPQKGTDHRSKKKASLLNKSKEHPEQKRPSSITLKTSLTEDHSTEEHQEQKRASSITTRTSLTEDQSTKEHKERKQSAYGTAQVAKKKSLAEDQVYEEIDTKYTPYVTMKTSLAEDQLYEEFYPKYFLQPTKKTNYSDEILLPEPLEQKRTPSAAKKKSLAESQLYEELDPKSFCQSMKKTSFMDEILLPEPREQKRTPSAAKKKSLVEGQLYEELDPKSFRQSMKKTSFMDEILLPEPREQKRTPSAAKKKSLVEGQLYEEPDPKSIRQSMKKTSFINEISLPEPREQKRTPSAAKKKSLPEGQLYEEPDPKSIRQSVKKTSFMDEILLPEPREQKRTPSAAKRKSLDEGQLYEELDPKSIRQSVKKTSFMDEMLLLEPQEQKRTPSAAKKKSLDEGQLYEELDPKSIRQSMKKTSFMDEMLLEPQEQKRTPSGAKKKSLAEGQLYEELDPKSIRQSVKKTSFMDEMLLLEPQEQKRTPSGAKKKSLAEGQLYEELDPKSIRQSVKKTSFMDEMLLLEPQEQKRTPSGAKKKSLAEDQLYEDLDSKCTPSVAKKKSLAEDQLYEDFDPKSHRFLKKTSSAEQNLFLEPLQQKSRRSRKTVYFVDEISLPEHLELKCSSSTTTRTSLTEDQSTEEYQELKYHSPNTKRPSFPDEKLTEEHLEPKRSVQYFHGDKISTRNSTTLPPQERDIQTMTEQKIDKKISGTSHLSHDDRIRNMLFSIPPDSARRTEVPRHSHPDIPKQEVTHESFNGKKTKKSSMEREAGQGSRSSWDLPNKQQTYYYEDFPQKVTSEELRSSVHDTWAEASVSSILYPAITNYEETVSSNLYSTPSSSNTFISSSRRCSSGSAVLMYNSKEEEESTKTSTSKSMEPPATSLGKRDSSTAMKKESQFTLDKTEQLNVTPLQTSNNFFPCLKPDTAEEEWLMDVRSKKDFNTSLITHSDQTEAENKIEQSITSDEEVILHDIGNEGITGGLYRDQAEDKSSITNTMASSRPPARQRSPRKNLSLSEYHSRSDTSSYSIAVIPPELMQLNNEVLTQVFNVAHMKAKTSNELKSVWEKTSSSVEEMKSSTEALSSMHDIVDSSSIKIEDLPSFTSADEERILDPSAKVSEESLASSEPDSFNIEYTILFQRESVFGNVNFPGDVSDSVTTISKDVPNVAKKESSVLPRELLRSQANNSKPALNFAQNKK